MHLSHAGCGRKHECGAIDFSCTDLSKRKAMKTNLYAALVVPAEGCRSRIERVVAATTTDARQIAEGLLEPGARVLKITLVVAGYLAAPGRSRDP
jgi:hypothetical protein